MTESVCPFCGKPHAPKQICKERLKALEEARKERTRPDRRGRTQSGNYR
jgi:hypothetical protein